jgi:hypothetical protein
MLVEPVLRRRSIAAVRAGLGRPSPDQPHIVGNTSQVGLLEAGSRPVARRRRCP